MLNVEFNYLGGWEIEKVSWSMSFHHAKQTVLLGTKICGFLDSNHRVTRKHESAHNIISTKSFTNLTTTARLTASSYINWYITYLIWLLVKRKTFTLKCITQNVFILLELSVKSPCLHPYLWAFFHPLSPLSMASTK
jgi:hypothetical protein